MCACMCTRSRGETEGEEKSEADSLAECGARSGAWSHDPEIMTEAKTKRPMLNWQQHPHPKVKDIFENLNLFQISTILFFKKYVSHILEEYVSKY